jgi:hypothetical protein
MIMMYVMLEDDIKLNNIYEVSKRGEESSIRIGLIEKDL